tara:strand:- start:508 stop:1227 length:720 start_codon:yes stop_codon:yes gene_type:complete
MKSNKPLAVSLLAIALLLTSCAGRTPNPVAMYQPGDDKLSCTGLEMQMAYCQQQIATLLPKSNKTGSNILLGVAGAFLIFPWFFMDFSDADRTEVEAWRARNNYLTTLFVEKDCGTRMMMPSLEDMKKDKQLAEKWAAQVEKDQVLLESGQAAEFETLDAAAKESDEELMKEMNKLNKDSSAGTQLSLSEEQYKAAMDRLLDLYTHGDIDKADYEREKAQLKKAREAHGDQADVQDESS